MAVSHSNILMPTIETAGDRGVRNIFLLRSNTVSVGNQIIAFLGEIKSLSIAGITTRR